MLNFNNIFPPADDDANYDENDAAWSEEEENELEGFEVEDEEEKEETTEEESEEDKEEDDDEEDAEGTEGFGKEDDV